MTTFTPERLVFARNRAGMTREQLATQTAMSTSTLAKYEGGSHAPPPEALARIAEALDLPPAFFAEPALDEVEPEVVSFRALSRMSARRRDVALASGTLATQLNGWLEERLNLPNVDVPRYVRGALDPESAAERLRFEWGLGYARVPNLVHLLESHGVRVFSLPDYLIEVDAFSFWWRGTPFAILNLHKTFERGRFDAAHELGHLVMHADHDSPRGRDREHEANRFAAAFLMPSDDIRAQGLRNAGADRVLAAKDRWGVAAMALAHRLHDLGITTDWTYTTTCRQLSQMGYRSGEPNSTYLGEREMSQLLEKAFAVLRERGLSQFDIARDLRLAPRDVRELLFGLTLTPLDGGQAGGYSPQPRLHVVPATSVR